LLKIASFFARAAVALLSSKINQVKHNVMMMIICLVSFSKLFDFGGAGKPRLDESLLQFIRKGVQYFLLQIISLHSSAPVYSTVEGNLK
jgi:hypothetical protein